MQTSTQSATVSNKAIWAGRIISALPVLLIVFSAILKLAKPPAVVQGFARFGYPEHLIPILAILELICTIIYLIPFTSVLGAILLTGYLGGATATNVRISDPAFIMPVFA
jgi:uncharacterized membrane protein YphA (DoxX/SURF4 family)